MRNLVSRRHCLVLIGYLIEVRLLDVVLVYVLDCSLGVNLDVAKLSLALIGRQFHICLVFFLLV